MSLRLVRNFFNASRTILTDKAAAAGVASSSSSSSSASSTATTSAAAAAASTMPKWMRDKPAHKQYRARLPIEQVAEGVYRYADGKTYRLGSAAIVERLAIVVAEAEPWEQEYLTMQWNMRRRSSRELGERVLDRAQQAGVGAKPSAAAKKAADAKPPTVEELDALAAENDASLDEMALFEPAPRITEADKTNDTKSLNRKLDQSLYLVVKKPRNQFNWQFPQGGYDAAADKLNLRVTAERELREECGDLRVHFYGNSPLFHIEYLFDDANVRQHYKADGAKIFFYPAIYLSGQVNINKKELDDFAWLTKEELSEIVTPQISAAAKSLFS